MLERLMRHMQLQQIMFQLQAHLRIAQIPNPHPRPKNQLRVIDSPQLIIIETYAP